MLSLAKEFWHSLCQNISYKTGWQKNCNIKLYREIKYVLLQVIMVNWTGITLMHDKANWIRLPRTRMILVSQTGIWTKLMLQVHIELQANQEHLINATIPTWGLNSSMRAKDAYYGIHFLFLWEPSELRMHNRGVHCTPGGGIYEGMYPTHNGRAITLLNRLGTLLWH